MVIPRVRVEDGYGGWKFVDGDAVAVHGSCQPMSVAETEALGIQASVTYQFITRGPWPWPMTSRVVWEGPDGQWPDREWDQHGEAKIYGMPGLTKHIDVTLKAREGES